MRWGTGDDVRHPTTPTAGVAGDAIAAGTVDSAARAAINRRVGRGLMVG